MKYWSRVCTVLLVMTVLVGVPGVFADDDLPDYRLTVKPDFQLSGEAYAKFETPVYPVSQGLNSLMVSVDIERSPTVIVRSYARFLYEKTGGWSRYQEFESEMHFADLRTVAGYQLMFILRDTELGTSRIARISVQGKKVGNDIMEMILKKPMPYPVTKIWPKPPIVSRADWKARPPKGDYNYHKPQKIVLHHSWAPTQAQYTGAATIRGIQNYHMDNEATGWADIGYHFLIGPEGTIYQGRPETAVGAHCPPNSTMVGICVIGNYDPSHDLNNAKIEASIINLMSWLSSAYSIDPKLYFYGHRNFSTKSCPGDMVYDRLPYYREEVLKNLGK